MPVSGASATPSSRSRPAGPSASTSESPVRSATTRSHGAQTRVPRGTARSTPRATVAGSSALWGTDRVSRASAQRVAAAASLGRGAQHLALGVGMRGTGRRASASLVAERSTHARCSTSGSRGPAVASAWAAVVRRGARPSPRAARTAASISSAGTDCATSKMRHSDSSGSVADGLSGSSEAWCSPATTRVAPRSTTSGQSAAMSASSSGRTSWKARTASRTASGSSGRCRRTDEQVTASSATSQLRPRSPKSMTPEGRTRPASSGSPTTLSSVTSPWIAWRRSEAATASTRACASLVRAATSARRCSSSIDGSSVATTSDARRRSHCPTRSRPGCSKPASAAAVRAASRPRSATIAGAR